MTETRDDWVRTALERVPVPAESPTFFADLWEEAQARERAAARRWRRTSVALAIVAAIAISSAAVLGASVPTTSAGVTDVREVCHALEQGGLPAFSIGATPSGKPDPSQINVKPPPGFHIDPSVWISTGSATEFGGGNIFTLVSALSGYQVDRRACSPTRRAIPLTRNGLPSAGVHLTNRNTQLVRRCLGTALFAFRIRITTAAKSGIPTSAQLAVIRARTGKLLAYFQWSPTRVDGWSVAVCE